VTDGDLRGALAPVKGGHHAAVTEPKAFGALLRDRGYPASPSPAPALRPAAVGVPSGPASFALPSGQKSTWTPGSVIPAGA